MAIPPFSSFTHLVLPITFHLAKCQMLQPTEIVDSEAFINFTNIHFAQLHQLPSQPKPVPVTIETTEGRPITSTPRN